MVSREKSNEKVTVCAQIPRQWLEKIEKLVLEGEYPSKSEVIRVAIEEFLEDEGLLEEEPTPLEDELPEE